MSAERLAELVMKAFDMIGQEGDLDPDAVDELTDEIEQLNAEHPGVISDERLLEMYTGLETRLLAEGDEDE